MNIYNNILVPSTSYLNQWFHDALTYNILKKRMLAGELKFLHDQDRKFLLTFINKQEWPLQAAKNNDEEFIRALQEAGEDFTLLDKEGNSLLVHAKTPQMFCWLLEKGVPFIQANNGSLLEFVLEKSHNWWYKEGKRAAWQNVLISILPKVALDDFCSLKEDELRHLLRTAKENSQLRSLLWDISMRIIKENLNGALSIAKKLLSHYDRQELKMGFIQLIKMGILTDPLIQQIVTDVEFLFWNTKNIEFFNALSQCWKPTGQLLELTQLCGDLRLGVYLKSILNAATLKESASLYAHISYFSDIGQLHETIKKQLIQHILLMQAQDRSTIWLAISKQIIEIDALLKMKELGFDPNWTDPVNNQTFLFTESAWRIECVDQNIIGFNMHHIDAHGNNALEHHCRHPHKKRSYSAIESLTKLGINLSDKFPNIQKCRNVFPDNSYLQALLGTLLLHPGRRILHEILHYLAYKQSINFSHTICHNPELSSILGKYVNSSLSEKLDYKNWRNQYYPADAERLKRCLKDSAKWILAFLARFWIERVPSEVFEAIPESPLVSLIIGAIKMQHQQLIQGKIKKLAKLDNLFPHLLTHNDMVYFNRYLFAHPDLMHILIQDYMNAKNIYIQSGGGSTTTYGKLVSLLMMRMDKLLQLAQYEWELPEWHKKLLEAFKKRVQPIPAETLNLPNNATLSLLGRTVIMTSETGCDALKFLKRDEKYDHFAQEYSVCKALHGLADQFKSHIIKPIGVYAVKHLPPPLACYQEQLSGNQPGFIFHYKAIPETFVYLQNVAAEKYVDSRSRTLHDAAKLIRLGIYPDLAAMFHNHQASRRYILLVDVMVRLGQHSSEYTLFSPAGGGGRLENPFIKIKYPNARESGMTDWRDARMYYGGFEDSFYRTIKDMKDLHNKEKRGVTYFYQMSALSNILLIDMLILAERYINEGLLQWKKDDLMLKFGIELAEGFAHLSASYSGQTYADTLNFTLQSGIDWTRAARQIAFWLDTGPEGYPGWVVQGKVPPGLYEESIDVVVDVSKAKNFEGQSGFRTNGELDIGAYNGPLALDQFEKAAHLLFNAVALAEPLMPAAKPAYNLRV
jgi:hypothetical protein